MFKKYLGEDKKIGKETKEYTKFKTYAILSSPSKGKVKRAMDKESLKESFGPNSDAKVDRSKLAKHITMQEELEFTRNVAKKKLENAIERKEKIEE